MNSYERALELQEETISHRRWFHQNAETGLDMPKGRSYVLQTLKGYGIDAKECGYGVTATIGNGGKVILLRADMDALPMPDESGEPFACPAGNKAHTCGHDFHAAMLLTAAKILKENESELMGTVKLMFQPAEETFEGAKNMIENGLLEQPEPDAALAYHVAPGQMPVGIYIYNNTGTMMNSVDGFRIQIHGKGAHGAYPHASIDPINIGVHIHLALQELIARESDPAHSCVMTIGHFEGGTAANIIPDTAVLEGTIRTNHKEAREFLVRRMKEVAAKTAELFGGTATVKMLSEVPPLICNPEVTTEMVKYMKEIPFPNLMEHPGMSASASEDFALIAEQIPSTMMYLSAGFSDERGQYPAHNPKVRFNEAVCPLGVAGYVHCAMSWLKNHK